MFGIKKRVAPFLTWSGEQRAYVDALPAKTKKAREALGKAGTKSDVLQREPLAAWFTAVQQLPNPIIAACLQMMLLTGARPGEVLALRLGRREHAMERHRGVDSGAGGDGV